MTQTFPNTAIKLGLPINQGFFDLATSKSKFDDVVYKKGHFHLLSACNGSLDLFKTQLDWQKLIVEIIDSKKKSYDFIFLDCPAGLNRSTLSLSSYCDHRFVIVTPDQSSMTDSYSLIKILNRQYKIKKNHLILNKVSRKDQYFKVTKTLSGLVKDFLSSKLSILGGIPFFSGPVDQFDRELIKSSPSTLHHQFFHIGKKFTEEFKLEKTKYFCIRDDSCPPFQKA